MGQKTPFVSEEDKRSINLRWLFCNLVRKKGLSSADLALMIEKEFGHAVTPDRTKNIIAGVDREIKLRDQEWAVFFQAVNKAPKEPHRKVELTGKQRNKLRERASKLSVPTKKLGLPKKNLGLSARDIYDEDQGNSKFWRPDGLTILMIREIFSQGKQSKYFQADHVKYVKDFIRYQEREVQACRGRRRNGTNAPEGTLHHAPTP